MAKKRLKDVDSHEQVRRIQALTWAVGVGAGMGLPAGGGIAMMSGGNVLVGAIIGFLGVAAGVYTMTMFTVGRAVSVAEMVHNPSGSSTPAKREYSKAESLLKRGLYQEAVDAYEVHCLEYPDDPQPYIQLARILRDRLQRHEESVSWFKRARAEAKITDGLELVITQELIELYNQKLSMPRKAMPELALLSKKFPETPSGKAAARELADLREILALEQQGEGSFTEQYRAKFGRAAADEDGAGP